MSNKLREIIRKEIDQLLEAKEPFDSYSDIKSWADKNKKKVLSKINFDKVRQNFPNLTDEQMEDYGSMIQYPYHSSFSLLDLKNYFKKLSNSQKGKISEGIPKDKSKKVADIFNNTPGFSYYAGQNDSSIVAPSTNNKKWYGKIKDMLDKANIGNYSLHPSQKPGYFILIFESKQIDDIKVNIENAFKLLNIKKSELDGWADEGDGYFIKGEFDKGVKIFKRGSNWYIATEDEDGYTDKEKKLLNNKNKIKELIDDYYFDVQHPD